MDEKGSDLFDVSIGAYYGAEECELIGTFLLNLLGRQYDTKNIGLCIRTMDCQFLRTVVVGKWERLRNAHKKYLRKWSALNYRV